MATTEKTDSPAEVKPTKRVRKTRKPREQRDITDLMNSPRGARGTKERAEYDAEISRRSDARIEAMLNAPGPGVVSEILELNEGLSAMREEAGFSRTRAFIHSTATLGAAIVVALAMSGLLVALVYFLGEADHFVDDKSRIIFSAFPFSFLLFGMFVILTSNYQVFSIFSMNGFVRGTLVILLTLFVFFKFNSAILDYAATLGKPDYMLDGYVEKNENSNAYKVEQSKLLNKEYLNSVAELHRLEKILQKYPEPTNDQEANKMIFAPEYQYITGEWRNEQIMPASYAHDEAKADVERQKDSVEIDKEYALKAARRAGTVNELPWK